MPTSVSPGNQRMAWGSVKTHPLPHTNGLTRTMFHRINMSGYLRPLHRDTFEDILGLLQETLDTWIAVDPVTEWHRTYTPESGNSHVLACNLHFLRGGEGNRPLTS